MNMALLTIMLMVVFLGLLVAGLPVAFVLLGVSVIFLTILVSPDAVYTVYSAAFRADMTDIYLAVPLFVFMACILQFSGIAEALYAMMYKWFAGLRGGLAIGTVAICTVIAAMTGIAATAVVTIGMLAFPEMEKRGYDRIISLGCIPSGGALGPLIPPSTLMIIVGGFGQLSVGKMFMGGVFPGLLMSLGFITYIAIRCWRNPGLAPALPVAERATWGEKFISLRGVVLPIILIFVVLGVLYMGITTTTEAGGIGAFGALVCAAINRKLTWQNLKTALWSSLKVDAMVMWLIMGGSSFVALLTLTGAASYIGGLLTGIASPTLILIIMMLIAFTMGMFMDGAAITMILLPIFMPVVLQAGIDPLWFALLFTINLIIGYVSPPFGMTLFYTKGVVPASVTMGQIYRSSVPYVIIMVAVLILSIVFQPITMWLPSIMVR